MEQGAIDLMEVALRRMDGSIFPAAISSRAIELEGGWPPSPGSTT